MPTITLAQSPVQKPNIIMFMSDDIGWANIGVYNQGIMAGRMAIAIRPQLERPLKRWLAQILSEE